MSALKLKQSTTATIHVGPFVDATDGVTLETGLAGTMTVKLSKAGGNSAARNSATAITHDSGQDGHYLAELNATDTNTLGPLTVSVQAPATHLNFFRVYEIVPAVVYDSLIAGSDNLQVDAIQISGDSGAADNLELFFDGTGYAAANSTVGTVTTLTGHTGQTGDTFALANGANGFVALKAETASILTDTAEIGAAGAGLTAVASAANLSTANSNISTMLGKMPTNYVMGSSDQADHDGDFVTAAQVNAQCDTAISDWATTAIASASTLASHTAYSPHQILLKMVKSLNNMIRSEASGATIKEVIYDDDSTTAINSRVMTGGSGYADNLAVTATDVTKLAKTTV